MNRVYKCTIRMDVTVTGDGGCPTCSVAARNEVLDCISTRGDTSVAGSSSDLPRRVTCSSRSTVDVPDLDGPVSLAVGARVPPSSMSRDVGKILSADLGRSGLPTEGVSPEIAAQKRITNTIRIDRSIFS